MGLKICFASDTHTLHNKVEWPDADILVHCGDYSAFGTSDDTKRFIAFLAKSKYKQVIMIAGNHDVICQQEPEKFHKIIKDRTDKVIYLQDSGCEIEGVKFWGTPWTRGLYQDARWAFGFRSEMEFLEKLRPIPEGIDVLVTHSPPMNFRDETVMEEHVGSIALLQQVVDRIKPKVHAFGHIHEAYGVSYHGSFEPTGEVISDIHFLNSAICNERYEPVNKPIVWEI